MALRQDFRLVTQDRSTRPLTVVRKPLTVADGETETIIQDRDAGPVSDIVLTPENVAASTLTWYITARDKGKITIEHSAPSGDAQFSLMIIG